MNTTSNRLETIANAQRKTRSRDFLFAAFVALATIISVSSVGSVAAASHDVAAVTQR